MRAHGIRIFLIWLVLTVIAEVLVGVLPIPSPIASNEALGAHQTVYMLFYVAVPFFVFVWVMLVYALLSFRKRPGQSDEGPPVTDSTPILLIWAAISFTTVVFLAGWGSFTLHEITNQDGKGPLYHIQVIGQQWYWSYRYPQFGGVESSQLILPYKHAVQFDITSLDVTHSFWIREMDVKEDAVPGNVTHAYLNATKMVSSNQSGANYVVCSELCGLYHGYMRSRLRVMTLPAYQAWGRALEAKERASGLLKSLPKFGQQYFPPPVVAPAPQDPST